MPAAGEPWPDGRFRRYWERGDAVEELATPDEVDQADEEALYALEAYMRPELDWRGYLGVALLVGAAVLVWRMP